MPSQQLSEHVPSRNDRGGTLLRDADAQTQAFLMMLHTEQEASVVSADVSHIRSPHSGQTPLTLPSRL
jgi:hypothetical protein